jgi:acetyl-CoA carboxylase biotin carboxylase subunit
MRLQRALYEYFVAGIKTNISLFQRILRDPDFQAGTFDTGYLDRLLARGISPDSTTAAGPTMAAIAAGLFSILDPLSVQGKNGSGASTATGTVPSNSSNWKQRGRSEALR